MPILLALQLLSGIAGPHEPVAPPTCYAPRDASPSTGIDSAYRRATKTTVDALVLAFTGVYDVVQVTTEGTSRPLVTRYTLRIFPTDTAAYCRWYGTERPCRDSMLIYPLAAYKGAILRPADSVQMVQRKLITDGVFNVRWHEYTRSVLLSDVTANDGGGDFLDVDEVTAEGFKGRWRDGGFSIVVFNRDRVPVGERISGYYCAWRRKPK